MPRFASRSLAALGIAAGCAGWGQVSARCPGDDTGLTLPSGFCATVFADGVGHARHLVVAPNGVVYVNTWSGRYYHDDTPHAGGFLVALEDTTGSGKANVNERFGETVASGGAGGTGIGLYDGALYAEINDKIVRYRLSESIAPPGSGDPILTGLPLTGDHPMHPFAIDADGSLYVDVATATNACQSENRTPGSPGILPCTELDTRGGIWRYDAAQTNQQFSAAGRYATGIRNAEGFAIDAAAHRLFVTQHGRDQLHADWPKLYNLSQEATLPAEELLRVQPGGDYGWPECYYDGVRRKLVLAPEYGGNGGARRGICVHKIAPIAAFPAHWAPNAMVLYDQAQFPKHYRDGVFIAFHGSWDRAPFAQGGYNVVFQPLSDGRAAGKCEIFADGFAGPERSPGAALHRPSGLAVGPDGSLYVSDDVGGRIYRIVYRGGEGESGATATIPCPSAAAPAGTLAGGAAKPPEGTHPRAGGADDLPVPPGATPAMVVLGERIFHGEVGGGTCTGCHGTDGSGSPLGPNLRNGRWLWSDGSLAGITATITHGVPQPKQYRAPMPAMGGAELSPEEVSAVAAYVWSLSHRGS